MTTAGSATSESDRSYEHQIAHLSPREDAVLTALDTLSLHYTMVEVEDIMQAVEDITRTLGVSGMFPRRRTSFRRGVHEVLSRLEALGVVRIRRDTGRGIVERASTGNVVQFRPRGATK